MGKRIVLEDGKLPKFDGQWTVGEVLQMAESLARWVQSLTVSPPTQEPQQPPDAAKETHGNQRRETNE